MNCDIMVEIPPYLITMNKDQIESQIDIRLPDDFDSYSEDTKTIVVEYLSQLSPIERRAYSIAKEHLKSSFDILHSNGYVNWVKER